MNLDRLFLSLFSCCFLFGCSPTTKGADMVFRGGMIFTADAALSNPEAVAIKDGSITYVGSAEGVEEWIDSGTEVVALSGKMLLPGLQDSHTHPPLGMVLEPLCRLDDAETHEAILGAVAACAARSDDSWVMGFGWRSSIYLPEIAPSMADLDRIVPDRAAVLIAKDMHTFWLNSRALERIGLDAKTVTPVGGEILRDARTGELLGIFRDTATEVVADAVPMPGMIGALRGLHSTIGLMNRYGYTAFMDARMDDPAVAGGYRALEALGLLNARVSMAVLYDPRRDLTQVSEIEELRAKFATERLDAQIVKIFVDGGSSIRSAASLPYEEGLESADTYISGEDLKRYLVELDSRGFTTHLHTLGDRATTIALDAIEAVRHANPNGKQRHAITHLVYPNPVDIARFAELNVIANISPYWAYPNEWTASFFPTIGPERKQWMYPFRALADQGVMLSGSSDYPFTPLNPFLAIEVGITRRDPYTDSGESLVPTEALTLEQLLLAYTRNAAYQNHREATTGSIEVGKLADLVVIDRNLFEIPASDISESEVLMTILEGEIVYQAEE